MIGDDEVFVRLKCFISKLNSSYTAFFQYPKQLKCESCRIRLVRKQILRCLQVRQIWWRLSGGAKLSQIYTNHFVRVPGITLLSDASVSDRQIHYVCFGHSCEQGIAYYPTIAPRRLYRSWNVSPTSSLMQLRMRKHATHKFIHSSNRMASNVKLQGRVVGWAGYPREIDLAGVFPKRGFWHWGAALASGIWHDNHLGRLKEPGNESLPSWTVISVVLLFLPN